MITSNVTLTGFTENLSISAIAEVRGSRFYSVGGGSGLKSGKNIALTGKMKRQEFNGNKYFDLSCLFFDGKTVEEAKKGREGVITNSSLSRMYTLPDEKHTTHYIIKDREIMSEEDIVKKLADNWYLKCTNPDQPETQVLPERFIDGNPDYGNYENTAPLYLYELAQFE